MSVLETGKLKSDRRLSHILAAKATQCILRCVVPIVMVSLGGVFLFSALSKSASSGETLLALSFVFGAPYSHAALYGLIAIEILLGALLVAGVAPRKSLGATALLLAAFVVFVTYLRLAGVKMGCGCGLGSSPIRFISDQEFAMIRTYVMFGVVVFALVVQTVTNVGAGKRCAKQPRGPR